MRSRVERLRWGLLAAGGSLLLLLAGLLGYGRFQALRSWHRVLERTGVSVRRETNGFTYSQSLAGRTVFTLHAAKAVQGKDGKYALHDVALTLYRQTDGRADHVYGSDFEYDPKTGVARALGEVQMDLQAPGALHRDNRTSAVGSEPKEDLAARPEKGHPDLEAGAEPVHVKTSGLVYVRNLGVAATDQDVEFRFGELRCHAHGAEFDSGQSTVRLLADVQVSGEIRGRAVRLTAARADLDRKTSLATLSHAEVRMNGETASADSAVVHLRPDGSPADGEANGMVRLTRGTQVLSAAHAEVRTGEGTTLREARFSGAVRVEDGNPERPLQAHAGSMRATFGSAGAVEGIVAEDGPSLQFYDGSGKGAGLRREMRGERMEAAFGEGKTRGKPELRWVKIGGKAFMSAESYVQPAVRMQTIAVGSAPQTQSEPRSEPRSEPSGESRGERSPASAALAGVKGETRIGAEALVIHLERGTSGKPEPRSIEGMTATMLEQIIPGQFERTSTGDRLTLQLSAARTAEAHPSAAASGAGIQLVSAVQEGHVRLRSRSLPSAGPVQTGRNQQTTEGSAQRAEFSATTERLLLIGQVHLSEEDGDLAAARIDFDPQTGEGTAQGQVLATLIPAAKDGGASPLARQEATHIAAVSARLSKKMGTTEFRATDAQPVRMWQGASQIEAAFLMLNQGQDSLQARSESAGGLVRCIFAASDDASGQRQPTPQAPPAGQRGTLQPAKVLRVSSARLDYTGAAHEAVFSGGVHTVGALGEARSQTASVFLGVARTATTKTSQASQAPRSVSPGLLASTGTTTPLGGAVERIVLSGRVQLQQPGRSGTGDQLLYTATNSSFVLSGSPGKPSHLVDAEQGSISGATLLFRTGDNTIVAAGDLPGAGKVQGRVRTELKLHP